MERWDDKQQKDCQVFHFDFIVDWISHTHTHNCLFLTQIRKQRFENDDEFVISSTLAATTEASVSQAMKRNKWEKNDVNENEIESKSTPFDYESNWLFVSVFDTIPKSDTNWKRRLTDDAILKWIEFHQRTKKGENILNFDHLKPQLHL